MMPRLALLGAILYQLGAAQATHPIDDAALKNAGTNRRRMDQLQRQLVRTAL